MAVAALLFAGVAALRFAYGDDAAAAVSMLYAMPVSLLAISRGIVAGTVAGIVAVVLTVALAVASGVDLSLVGWLSRTVPLLLVGLLLGDAAARLRRAERERRRLEEAELRHRQAIEINDSLFQGMAAAKWSIEAGRVDAGLATLDDTLLTGQRLVSQLIREAGATGPGRPTRTG
jgi:uncharacterized membrane protein YfcA